MANTITTIGRQAIIAPIAYDAEGPIPLFSLTSVPGEGKLYIGSSGGSALAAGGTLTADEASNLYYEPPTSIDLLLLRVLKSGIYTFTFRATDSDGAVSNPSTYSIPVGSLYAPSTPTPATVMSQWMLNSGGEVQINSLKATGTAIGSYRLTSIPPSAEGVLYTISSATGLQTAITELPGGYQELTVAEAENLWFAPVTEFKGTSTFTYTARSTTSSTNSENASYYVPVVSESDVEPLPVELLRFSANSLNNGNVLLTWETASEVNNAYFIIERSTDGQSYAAIGKVDGKGNSNNLQKYMHKDVILSSGIYYYRLKQVDLDGSFIYSKIVAANGVVNPTDKVVIYLNSSRGNLTVKVNTMAWGTISVQVLDVQGQENLRRKRG
ncbi:hypothetical protein ABID22_000788 [Pontibacter aydingkolensis]|uniref:Uncharacterized protein n=1 Tax=Pontibacter aydingkolensis TaxID=1911536 RepID=A0ABS7CRC6_9BACT|nr:hypothetical protein [Pontibacter aydingkolensis]MBW7466343.1 hypothetical protein [Pontibacter aydingkolensis]